jgi:hypothetical protein
MVTSNTIVNVLNVISNAYNALNRNIIVLNAHMEGSKLMECVFVVRVKNNF